MKNLIVPLVFVLLVAIPMLLLKLKKTEVPVREYTEKNHASR